MSSLFRGTSAGGLSAPDLTTSSSPHERPVYHVTTRARYRRRDRFEREGTEPRPRETVQGNTLVFLSQLFRFLQQLCRVDKPIDPRFFGEQVILERGRQRDGM